MPEDTDSLLTLIKQLQEQGLKCYIDLYDW